MLNRTGKGVSEQEISTRGSKVCGWIGGCELEYYVEDDVCQSGMYEVEV